MRFYRVAVYFDGNSAGYRWHTSKAEAMREKRREDEMSGDPDFPAEVKAFDIEPTKAGILHALRLLAAHPDNG